MKTRFLAGLAVLALALMLQFLFVDAGVQGTFSYAALIGFAFVFGFRELVFFVLLAVFMVNWQPAASPEILVYALYPFVVLFCRNFLHWQVWLEGLLAIIIGFMALYLAISPASLAGSAFFTDVILGAIFCSAVIVPLHRWGKA